MDFADSEGTGNLLLAKGTPVNNQKVEALAVQNATGSLEIMGQLVLNEWELLRHNIREFGRKIRQMSANVAALTINRLWNQLLSLLRRHSDTIPAEFELDAAMILNEMQRAEVERPPPRDTFLDVRRVVTEDWEEDGIVHARLAPRWREMPPPRRREETGSPIGDYQLFNRPMTIADDEFDRLSLPSTTFAQSESERIVSLEAQLSLLNKQLNMLMMSGMPNMGGGGSQRSSRPVSRTHSRASLYQGQNMNASMSHPSTHHHSLPHHESHGHALPPPSHSPSPTSDDDGVYINDDSSGSYASPSHTVIPLPHLPHGSGLFPPHQQITVAGRRESMIMTGDASSAIPLAPPLPPFVLQAPPIGLHGPETDRTLQAFSPPPPLPDDSLLPPFSPPLPPPPPALVKTLQRKENTELLATAGGSTRSFLDDISKGNFNLKKTSTEKSPTGSLRSSSGDEEMEDSDENATKKPTRLVKPTTTQLLSRKTSLRRISADRSPGGTPQNRSRRRFPSLGKDGGKALLQGDYLAAALANKFNTIRVNEEDDDQSVTGGDQSWCDD